MPGPAEFTKLLPLIVKLFPELVKPTFYRGAIGLLSKTDPTPDENLERALQTKTRVKKDKTFNDATAVLKVSDAIKCLEDNFNETSLMKEVALRVVKDFFNDVVKGTKEPISAAQNLADKMANCFREHALRQDTPRAKHRTTSHGRPARGHGKGR